MTDTAATLTLLFLTALYFLPTMIAGLRGHHQCGAIIVLNFLTGWTVIGWIIAMVWASTRVQPQRSTHA